MLKVLVLGMGATIVSDDNRLSTSVPAFTNVLPATAYCPVSVAVLAPSFTTLPVVKLLAITLHLFVGEREVVGAMQR